MTGVNAGQFPSVSVIMPTSNSAGTIAACLQSIIDQRYPSLELILIDNLSTDLTTTIATTFVDQGTSIRIVSERDDGIYAAMNKGIRLTSGDWLYFLGADDVLKPGVLREVFGSVCSDEFDLVYGDVELTSGKIVGGEFTALRLSRQNLCHQSAFYRRDLFDRLGYYEVKYKVWADWEFNWRCFGDREVRRKHVPVVIARYGEDGFSSTRRDGPCEQDAPILLLKHHAETSSADEMHQMVWPRVCRYVEDESVARGLALMLNAGIRTRRPLQYLAAAIYWKARSLVIGNRAYRK